MSASGTTVTRMILRYGGGIALLACCLLQLGCVQDLVRLREQPYNPLAERLQLYARGGPKPSPRTQQLLRRNDLVALERHSAEQLAALRAVHHREPTPDSCYALAELGYIAGKKLELHQRDLALTYYWSSAADAYAYLFDPQYASTRNRYDPQFRNACDLYNSSLESCLRIAQRQGALQPGRSVTFQAAGQQLQVSIVPVGFQWSPEEFDHFEFVSDYDVQGITNKHQTFGLGVPLIAVRRNGRPASTAMEKYYARGLSFPVTAFLRIQPASRESEDSRFATATLELYDPLQTTEVVASDESVPLESDITTPLAYFLNNPQLRHLDTFGLFFPGKAEAVSGLYMVQPYQPDKIPVLMVHGLWSSPMTWMEMFNDLRADPEIRDRYQFWFYLYPTGKPFWESAAALRRDLAELRAVCDPRGTGQNLDEMVLVGHSMGGLIARMVTLEGGDHYWQAVSPTPMELVSASEETKSRLRELYYFEPDEAVSRVVTIGSPHRGSHFANDWTRWLARKLISLPRTTLETTFDLLTRNPRMINGDAPAPFLSNSIDGLSPNSPILQTMAESPQPPDVRLHNIVGVRRNSWLFSDGDGVVPFDSAHLEFADSELIVEANHSEIHQHPRTVQAVREILKAHLQQAEPQRRFATPIRNADAAAPVVAP